MDGRYAFFGCGVAANTARIVVRVDAAGTVDTTTTYTTGGQSSYLPRG